MTQQTESRAEARTQPKPAANAGDYPERIVPGTAAWQMGYADHVQRYRFAQSFIARGALVLDAGCGSGYGSALLADSGVRQVIAVDISTEALTLARQHFPRESVVWLQDDCHTLEHAAAFAPFDAVCCLENIEHLAQPERFLAQAARLLAPHGVLVVSSPNRILTSRMYGTAAGGAPQNPHHHREYSAEEFRALLERNFRDVRLSYQCHATATRVRMAVEPVLQALWSNPMMRLGRWVQRVLRGRAVPDSPDALLPPLHGEWVVLDANPGEDVTWVLLAVCREPMV